MKEPAAADVARFWSKVDKDGPVHPTLGTKCWPWTAGADKDGYGKFQYGPHGEQTHVRAHRFALKVERGGDGPAALHACDNRPCCNPWHLSWGTQADNRADCVSKGRGAKGDTHGSRVRRETRPRGGDHGLAKLTDDSVAEIRRRYQPRRGVGALAREFGVSRSAINDIMSGRTWRAFS